MAWDRDNRRMCVRITVLRIAVFLGLCLGFWGACVAGLDAPRAAGQEAQPEATAAADVPADPLETAEPNHSEDESDEASAGYPTAAGVLELVMEEVDNGLQQRNIAQAFDRFQSYGHWKLDTSSGPRTPTEVTARCRLDWYDKLYRNMTKAPFESEALSGELHRWLDGSYEGLVETLAIAREKLDIRPGTAITIGDVDSPDAAIAEVTRLLIAAQSEYQRALSPLTTAELTRLTRELYPRLTGEATNGHTLPQRLRARSLCLLLEKIDRAAMCRAGEYLAALTHPAILEQLARLQEPGDTDDTDSVDEATPTMRTIPTMAGDIVIGYRGVNTHSLDRMENVCAVIDLGGDDLYLDGTATPSRPVLAIIDLGGDDTYRGTKPGIQAGAILGVSLLLDRHGDDTYHAEDLAQASVLGGVGLLIDEDGNDSYRAVRRGQATALGGVAVHLDLAGNDRYRAAMWGQGLGHPLGFAVLEDRTGDDLYFLGGQYHDSYPETPGYEGWGQGLGAGIRQVANGGIGLLLDGNGDDKYEFDYMSHGGGYWLGVGILRDFAGNDHHAGATTEAFTGGPRRERRFQRFSNGFGCHYALGFLFDDGGRDTYDGTIMGLGMAWDMSMGMLADFDGNDRYEATGGYTQGTGAEAGFGILFDYNGNDVYLGYGQGYARPTITYHDMPRCGGNFSFLIDYGGQDEYGCRVRNDTFNRRGSYGGFIIDRPRADETETETTQ